MPRTREREAPRLERSPGDYVVGAPISLADFLALPPDGQRYGRDAHGRLSLVIDKARAHRFPLSELLALLLLWARKRGVRVMPEPGIAFDPIFDLRGRRVPESFFGAKALAPDLVCFGGEPAVVETRRDLDLFSPDRIRLIVEVVSASSRKSDLGTGRAHDVDRWHTYEANGVAEYWLLNPSDRTLGPLPPRSALFLTLDPKRGRWRALPVVRGRVAGSHRSFPVVTSGRIRSRALLGFALDLGAFWRSLP